MCIINSYLRRFAVTSLASTLLAGCMVGPNFHSPTAPDTSRYTETPLPANTTDKAQCFVNGQDIPSQWWTLFHSPDLNTLIQTGLTNSPNLAAAQAALRQAQQTLYAQIGSSMLPNVSALGSAQRQAASNATSTAIPGSSVSNVFNTNLNVSYTLDIFGGARRQIEALAAQVDYQQFQLEAAYLTLTSNIVTTAITTASLRAQIEATQDLIQAQTDQLAIVNKQLQLGGASNADVLSQQSQLAQTQASLPPLEKSLAQARDALAVLVGAFPGDSHLPEFTLDKFNLPAQLPVSLPANLVRQRPDIRASEALLHAASAQVGVATANLLPQISLSGAYGWSSSSTGDLFTPGNIAWNILGQVTQPLFQGGALMAKRKGAMAAYDQALAQYHQTVLQAFQNVADTLRALETDAQTLQAQQQAETAARNALNLTQTQYRLGGVSYLALLTAQRQYQQTRINRIQAQAARYIDTATLFQALGGGWWNRPNPETTL